MAKRTMAAAISDMGGSDDGGLSVARSGGGRRRRGQRGGSLIEVLAVLVILVAGILLMVRIFPIGLGTLQTTGNRTLAGQLASQQNDQLKNDAANLPMGVLLGYFDNTNGNLVLDGSQDPDDLRPYVPGSTIAASNTAINPYFTDVNRYRYIKGERIPVPPVSTQTLAGGGTVTGSFYLLKFGPIFMDPNKDGDPTTVPATDQYLHVYGAPLQRITAQYATGTPDNSSQVNYALRGAQTYLIDYGDTTTPAHIMFDKSVAGKSFYIDFSYIDSATGNVVYVDSAALNNPTVAVGGQWQILPTKPGDTTGASQVIAGSDQVSRVFTRLADSGGSVSWSDDPYEYALVSANSDLMNGGYANLGRIVFNPHGANYSERAAAGQQDFVAYADYSVLDWHILREDRQVALGGVGANNSVVVRTTLPRIKQMGTTINADNTIYGGLFGPGSGVDLIVVNQDTGAILSGGDWNNAAGASTYDYWVDSDQRGGTYQDGYIYVNTARVPQGTHLRILYQAEGDWAVALQKAYSSYRYQDQNPTTPTGFPSPTQPGTFSKKADVTTGADDTNLYFNLSEANKSFVAQFQYQKTDGSTAQTAPIQITIGDVASAVTYNGLNYAVANIAAAMPGRAANTNWSVVGNVVTGVSLKTRVVYHDGNSNAKAVGAADPMAGWRIQDLDTYLTPASDTL